MKEYNLFFSINEEYVPILEVVIRSFIENNSGLGNNFYIHILYLDICPDSVLYLESFEKEDIKIKCERIDLIRQGLEISGFDRFPAEALLRMLIPDLFPTVDKALYLDSDILIRGNIEELFKEDLGGNLIGAVKDYLPIFERRYVQDYLCLNPDEYFNSGVILMNLDQMRKEDFLNRFIECYRSHPDYRLVDQDILNDICKNRVVFLNIKWNYQRHHLDHYLDAPLKKELKDCIDNAIIVHFTGSRKPWVCPEVEFGEEFIKYAAKSDHLYQILRMGSIKRVQYRYDYIFPIDLIRPKSRVVLYGAGQVGKAYYKEITYTNYCNIVLWVDKNYKSFPGKTIHSPKAINGTDYDYVLIAIVEIAIMKDIKNELIDMGVEKDKIIWKHPVATDKDLFSLYDFTF